MTEPLLQVQGGLSQPVEQGAGASQGLVLDHGEAQAHEGVVQAFEAQREVAESGVERHRYLLASSR